MRPTTDVQELLDHAAAELLTNEEEWPEWLPECDAAKLMGMLGEIDRHKRELNLAEKELRSRMQSLLGDGGRVHDGHSFYRNAPNRERVAHDPRTVFEYLGGDGADCFHIKDMKITAFRAVARRRAEEMDDVPNPESFAKMVEESLFFMAPRGEPKLQKTPIDRAPKYTATMKPGKVTKAKPRKKKE